MFLKGIILIILQVIRVVSFFLIFKLLFLIGDKTLVANFTTIESYVKIFACICSFGVYDNIVRLFKDYKGNLSLFLKNEFKVFLVLYFFCCLIIFFTSDSIENSSFIYLFIILNLITDFFAGLFILLKKPIYSNLLHSFFAILFLLCLFFLYQFAYNSNIIYFAWGLSKILLVIISYIYFNKSLKSKFSSKEFFSNRLFLNAGSSFTLINLSNLLNANMAIIFVAFLGSEIDVISLKLGQQLSLFVIIIIIAFSDQIKSKITDSFMKNNFEDILVIFKEHRLYSSLTSIFYIATIFIFLSFIINFLSPNENLNINIIYLMLITPFFQVLIGPVPLLYIFTKYEFQYLKFKLIYTLILFLSMFPLIKIYGILTYIIINTIFTIIFELYIKYWIFKKLNFSR